MNTSSTPLNMSTGFRKTNPQQPTSDCSPLTINCEVGMLVFYLLICFALLGSAKHWNWYVWSIETVFLSNPHDHIHHVRIKWCITKISGNTPEAWNIRIKRF